MTSPFEIAFDGALIRGEAEGFGIPVVLLHAGVADRRMWQDQVQELVAAGYHVISYDRRGHGETESEDVEFSHLVDLEAVLDRLSIHAAVLVGASAGGALAIDFALEHPERTIGLVLVGTGLSGEAAEVPEEAEGLVDARDYALERGNVDSVNRIDAHLWLDGAMSEAGRVEGPARELFYEMNARVLAHPPLTGEEETDPPAADFVERITAPTLLVVGELDLPDIVARHDDLSERLENAFAVVLEDTAHLPSLERPDLFDPLLMEFLDAITGPGAGEGEYAEED